MDGQQIASVGWNDGVVRGTYKAHESVRIGLLLLASAASIWLALGAELLAHPSTVVVHLICVMVLRGGFVMK